MSFVVEQNYGADSAVIGMNERERDIDGSKVLDGFMRDQERRLISDALRLGRSKKETAEILGISPRTLRYKLARLREQSYLMG